MQFCGDFNYAFFESTYAVDIRCVYEEDDAQL